MTTDDEFDVMHSDDPIFQRGMLGAAVEHYERELDRRDERIRGLTIELERVSVTLAASRSRFGRLYGTWFWRASRRVILGRRLSG